MFRRSFLSSLAGLFGLGLGRNASATGGTPFDLPENFEPYLAVTTTDDGRYESFTLFRNLPACLGNIDTTQTFRDNPDGQTVRIYRLVLPGADDVPVAEIRMDPKPGLTGKPSGLWNISSVEEKAAYAHLR